MKSVNFIINGKTIKWVIVIAACLIVFILVLHVERAIKLLRLTDQQIVNFLSYNLKAGKLLPLPEAQAPTLPAAPAPVPETKKEGVTK